MMTTIELCCRNDLIGAPAQLSAGCGAACFHHFQDGHAFDMAEVDKCWAIVEQSRWRRADQQPG